MSASTQTPAQEHGRWLRALWQQARDWVQHALLVSAGAQTRAYVDLIFAFGLAKVGEGHAARELLDQATGALNALDEAHACLLAAFRYRIRQALDGEPHTGTLPAEQIEFLAYVDRLQRMVVDRLRELPDLTDPEEVVRRVDRLLADLPQGRERQEQCAHLLRTALQVATWVGEDFARRMLALAVRTYDAWPDSTTPADLIERAGFLERSLFVAGHFGLREPVPALLEGMQQLTLRFGHGRDEEQRLSALDSAAPRRPARGRGSRRDEEQRLSALDSLVRQSVRTLVRLSLCDELDQFLGLLASQVLEGRDVQAVDFRQPKELPALLVLLRLAEGWFAFGWDSLAQPVMRAARSVLFGNSQQLRIRTMLACAYASALGQVRFSEQRHGLEELFRQLDGIHDTYTTSTHYQLAQLEVVESAVLAAVQACTRAHPT
jgi:hypothetical protein